MIIRNINLETVCGITSKLPENTLPEIAFAGKSNVGKSSLINALMNRKSYARISATPGKTQTINFYNINEELYLVDLPGYGYAKVAKSEKKICEGIRTGENQMGTANRTLSAWIKTAESCLPSDRYPSQTIR